LLNNNLTYGPVPSRRLGRSLGVNNITAKNCSYSCVYCQIGNVQAGSTRRRVFHQPIYIARAVKERLEKVRQLGEKVDYIAFVPDGEPTLDINLGNSIDLLKSLGLPIAVITNASFVWDEDAREQLSRADWVSLKIDAATEGVWRTINRPHKSLSLEKIFDGIITFSSRFAGDLNVETMLLDGINDDPAEIEKIASFVATVNPSKCFLAVPTRPPSEKVMPAGEDSLVGAYKIFTAKGLRVEYLIGYEGNDFTSAGNPIEDLLNITSVHPMRQDAVKELLGKRGIGFDAVVELVNNGAMKEVEYKHEKYYIRKFK